MEWSKQLTHCAVCLRPFAQDEQERRHFERECDDPCWCVEFCWVEYGGDCIGPRDGDPTDEMSMWAALRGAQARLAAARAVIAERPDVIEAARAAVAHDCATGTQALAVALVDAIGDET